jgi:hypothetical protein
VKELHNKKCKLLKKKIEEDMKRWKYLPSSWIRRINILKKIILSTAIYIFNAISMKVSMIFIRLKNQP